MEVFTERFLTLPKYMMFFPLCEIFQKDAEKAFLLVAFEPLDSMHLISFKKKVNIL
jgi:hypothetical protein